MPLGLDPRCLERLRKIVAEVLPRMQVHYGTVLSSDALIDLLKADAVPPKGVMQDTLQAYVGENAVSTFLYHRLNAMLHEGQYPREAKLIRLLDLPGFPDAEATAARLIAEFESLPWEYRITFVMPKAFSEVFVPEIGSHQLSEKVVIVSHDATLDAEYPIPEPRSTGSFADLALIGAVPRLQAGNAYLRAHETGFIAAFGGTALSSVMEGYVRTLAGLGLALNLFRWSRPYKRQFSRPAFVVHRRVDEHWVFQYEVAWETDQSRTFAELLLEDLHGQLGTPEKAKVMQAILTKLTTVFSNGQRSRRIRLGAQWLFDSFCENDLPLAFVEAAVVLEVLLGEKAAAEEMGVTKLLANRCAYLIATSQSERERVINDFTDIYDVRSKIVHEGKSTLSLQEHTQLITLRRMCSRVIRREIELLEKETLPATSPS